MANDIYGDFYNPTKLISTNKPYLFSIGVRSCGKSTGWCIHLLKEYMKHKHQFIYLRRDKDELEQTAGKAFTNAVILYNSYYQNKKEWAMIEKFEYKGGIYYINDEICGYGLALSTQHKAKSLPLNGIYWILYDEFLLDEDSTGHYLGGKDNPYKECTALYSLYVTCDRGINTPFRNEVRVVCIGNNKKYLSPIFMAMGVDRLLTRETTFLNPKNEGYALEQTFAVKALEESEKSNAYWLATDRDKAYTFKGGVFDNTFIGKPESKIYPMCNLKYNEYVYGVGTTDDGYVFISNKPYNVSVNLALTGKDHAPNYKLVKAWHNSYYMVTLRDAITIGKVYYESQRAKYAIETFFAYDR